MVNILQFKRPKASEKHKGNTLCRQGHHKWEIVKDSIFDSQQGCLVTRYECSRCHKVKIKKI